MNKNGFAGFLPVVLLIIAWESFGRSGLFPKGIFPPFSAVMVQFYALVKNGVLVGNFLASLVRVVVGFSLGSLLGIFVGTFMGWNKYLDKTLSPLISILYPIPALGWLPILMIWVGVNEALPIIIIFICSFFPVAYSAASGIKNVDRNFVEVARTLGASPPAILKRVVFPLALPYIFTGLRIEAGMAWRVIIAAEMVAIPTGIGALMMRAENLIRMDIIIVCLLVLSIMTFLFEKLLIFLEKFATGWKSDQQNLLK
ncbi:MAG: ABC transporter permease [Elusimicrobia bacterium]|nr:ABC transporter permease [Elusimicrobiota bacterium]